MNTQVTPVIIPVPAHDAMAPDPLDSRPVIDLRGIFAAAWRHRLPMLGIVLGTLLLGLVISMLMTPRYTSYGSIQVDQEAQRILDSQAENPVAPLQESERFLRTTVDVLQSRRMAERAAEELKLFNNPEFAKLMRIKAPEGTDPKSRREDRDRVVKAITENLGIDLRTESRVIVIGFRSTDPEFSAKFVNAFIANFLRYNIERKLDQSTYARDFLAQQLEEARQRLERAEREANAYARGSGLIRVPIGDGSAGADTTLTTVDLSRYNEALASARTARIAAQAKWEQTAGASNLAIPEVASNKALQDLYAARATVSAKLEEELATKQQTHPDVVPLRRQLSEYDQQINALASGIRRSLRDQYAAAQRNENDLASRVQTLKGATQSERDSGVALNTLNREVETSRQLYDSLLQRYRELSAEANITANNVQQIDIAEAPLEPSSPRLLLNAALALLAGLGLAALYAFLREMLDDRLRGPADVESKLGLKLLGVTPLLADGVQPVAALEDPKSAFSESIYSLRTAVQFATPDGLPQRLLVTSSQKGEGKSTTAFGLARAVAELGHKVVLVDCDLRRPSQHNVLGIQNTRGLVEVLAGQADLDTALVATATPGLQVLPTGGIPANPSDILASAQFREFALGLAQRFDVAIFDAPPVLGLADAAIIAAMPGMKTLVIIQAENSMRGRAKGAIRRLRDSGADLIGAVLSQFDFSSARVAGGADGYSYGYNYYEYEN